MTIRQCFENKFKQIDGAQNIRKPQRELKKRAFIKNTLNVLYYIVRDKKLDEDGLYGFRYIPQYKWKEVIKNNDTRGQVFDFLKQYNIIEVKSRNGAEYYLPQCIAFQNLPQCKAYRLTKQGCEILLNSSVKSIDDLYSSFNIQKQNFILTPAEYMQKYKGMTYFLPKTRECIVSVLNNNLQLQFHPQTVDRMVQKYKADVKCRLSDEMIKDKLQMVEDYFSSKSYNYDIRMYSAFTNCPKSWRDCVTDAENNHIGELFDVHSSVFNLLPIVCRIKILQRHENLIDFEKEERFLQDVLSKDIYETIACGMRRREQIKAKVMQVIFSNNQKFSSLEMTPRGKIRNCAANNIKTWMQNNIPIMYKTVSVFEQERNSKYDVQIKRYEDYLNKRQNGIKMHHVNKPLQFKSKFWVLFQQMETELMANLNVLVSERFGVKIYNIHDGLYAPISICTAENRQIVQGMYNDLKKQLIAEINRRYGYMTFDNGINEQKSYVKDFFKNTLQKIYRRNNITKHRYNKSIIKGFKGRKDVMRSLTRVKW